MFSLFGGKPLLSAEGLMFLGGTAAFFFTLYHARNRAMREKYAVVWLFVALLLLTCGIFPNIIMGLAERANLAYSSAVLYLALGAIYLFSISVSLSLSRQHHRGVRLLQEIAILENRVRSLEAEIEKLKNKDAR